MNILFLHQWGISPLRGGISRMTSVLGEFFEKKGYHVYYLSFVNQKGVKYQSNQFFFPIANSILSKENELFFDSFLQEKEIDVLINQASMNKQVVRFVSKSKYRNLKKVSIIHNSLLTPIINYHALNEFKLRKLKMSFLLPLLQSDLCVSMLKNIYRSKHYFHYKRLQQNSDKIVFVAPKNEEDLFFILGRKIPHVAVIRNSISLPAYRLEEKEKIILWAGTPDFSIKRIDIMLKIWSIVSLKHEDWIFKILGDSIYLVEAKKMAIELNLKRINFEGRVDPNTYYKTASFLCMTSTTESFGLVLAEAMHYGVIPFAFDSFPAVREIIDDQKNGFIIPKFKIEKYASVLACSMENEEDINNMRKAAIEKSKKFNMSIVGNEWTDLLNNL
jgi:glycosyltransferase involved in cell wall biosynthesis